MGDFIKENFPNTYSLKWLVPTGGALLSINVLRFLSETIAGLILTVFSLIGFILIIILLLVFTLELLAKTFPVLWHLMIIVSSIPRFISGCYIKIIKILIKGSVISILEEKGGPTGENLSLENESGADKFWDKLIRFDYIKSVELMVVPSTTSYYWRFGLKFSENEIFTPYRFASNFPLFHLTKNNNDTSLRIDYYNSKGQHECVFQEIIPNYQNKQIKLVAREIFKFKNYLIIDIFNGENRVFSKEFSFAQHRYAQVFAWGDGNPYKLNIQANIA